MKRRMNGHERQFVLVIGAEEGLARMLRLTLRDEGFNVAFTNVDGHGIPPEFAVADVVVVDLQPRVSRDTYAVFEPEWCDYGVPVVALSGEDPLLTRQQTGADAALQKPFDGERLAEVIRAVLRGRRR